MSRAIEFYGDSISGNCYKLQLAATQLGIAFNWHEMDILAGETRTESFLAMNPNGKVPIAVLDDGRVLTESNAILCYLAEDHALAGADRYARARILSWLFFEQYSHEPYIATSRFIMKYLGSPANRQADLDAKRDPGYRALRIMEGELERDDFIANAAYSIADIALYAYTHVAHEGGFDLAEYPRIRAWLRRVEAQPDFVPMRKQ